MKAEAWIFGICAAFILLVTPVYWLMSEDPTGTAALTMTCLLAALVFFYLYFHAARMEPRPEDRKDAEIADGAGELGFFPPHAWWLFIIGGIVGACALCGLIFEYYVGEHAH